VETLSPEDYICDALICITYLNGEFMYRDARHIAET
jgi:hypothetical protein